MSSPASPSLSSSHHGPRPLQLLVDGTLHSPAPSSCPSPTASGLSTPPPSARKFNSRRQSSIAYFPSDHEPTWDLRSPTAAPGSGSSLKRSSSLNQRPAPERLSLKGDRRSLPASGILGSPQPERPPLTLTEKHADLLRFIAQKESKCLELRSQLAAHEAELAQLKRKWERIVARGMDRAYTQGSSGSSHASGSSLLSGAVKEGVQGVTRLLAAGLNDISGSPSPRPDSTSAAPRTPILPLRTSRVRNQGHSTTQSTSSVSTAATSLTSSSVRLSQSSASSLGFDEPAEAPSPSSISDDPEQEISVKRTSICVDGGTGIESVVEISPSSASRTAKLHRRKSREAPPSPSLLPSSQTPASSSQTSSNALGGSGGRAYMQEDHKKTIKRSSLHITAGGNIPPAASIPGLGPLAAPLTSAWMGSVGSSVGKKWEELQKGQTFAKSQKRASLLFSDVSSSIFAALASPSSSTSSPSPAAPSSVSISSNPFAATLSPLSLSPTPSPLSRSQSDGPALPSARSLLEDDDDPAGDAALGSVLVPDTKPPAAHTQTTSTSTSPSSAGASASNGESGRKSLLDDDDDEEWNW
ncbi:hypothetical protein BN946_scf185015.g21 [Trametes cinnabarina]|uniref:Uncharacterized protein n=1 Tax=Pycnoporus cinnabarinus TaxID=5643 RepID=A0A060SMP5_PYCCI|nr:hypothetical protein BN946_scf185015.g21 [Trametes cinnabarina]